MLIAISLRFDTTKFFENCVQVTFLLGPNACAQPLLSRQSRGRTVRDLPQARQFLKQTCLTSDRFVSFKFQSTRPSQNFDGMTTIPALCGCHLHTTVLPCIHASLLLLRCFLGSVALQSFRQCCCSQGTCPIEW